jgi:hypothetical protein
MATTPAVYQDGEVTKLSPISTAPVTLEVTSVKGIGQTWYANSNLINPLDGQLVDVTWLPTDDGVITGNTFVAPVAGVYQFNINVYGYTSGATVSGTLRVSAHEAGGIARRGETVLDYDDETYHAVDLTLPIDLNATGTVIFRVYQTNNSGLQGGFNGQLVATRIV